MRTQKRVTERRVASKRAVERKEGPSGRRKGGRKRGREGGRGKQGRGLYQFSESQSISTPCPGDLRSIWKNEVAKYGALNSCPLAWKLQLVPALWPASPSPFFLPGWLPLATGPRGCTPGYHPGVGAAQEPCQAGKHGQERVGKADAALSCCLD